MVFVEKGVSREGMARWDLGMGGREEVMDGWMDEDREDGVLMDGWKDGWTDGSGTGVRKDARSGRLSGEKFFGEKKRGGGREGGGG